MVIKTSSGGGARRVGRAKSLKIVKGGSGEFAYRALRDEIVSLALEPGADLDEARLVARLGLSRTPLREALVRLAGEGLVELLPNRGARVAPMGWTEIREHLEAFDMAQRLVTRWAALRRTDRNLGALEVERAAFEAAAARRDAAGMVETNWRFHAAIAAACGNTVVAAFYERLLMVNLRIARLAMSYDCFASEAAYESHLREILHEHRAMVEALRERDAERAEELARSHADLARKRVSESLTQSLTPEMALSLGG